MEAMKKAVFTLHVVLSAFHALTDGVPVLGCGSLDHVELHSFHLLRSSQVPEVPIVVAQEDIVSDSQRWAKPDRLKKLQQLLGESAERSDDLKVVARVVDLQIFDQTRTRSPKLRDRVQLTRANRLLYPPRRC